MCRPNQCCLRFIAPTFLPACLPACLPAFLQGVRTKNHLLVLQSIEARSLLAKPAFNPTLRDLMTCIGDLRHVHLAWASPTHIYTVHEYAELQVRGHACAVLIHCVR
jgi:hypothetical protein